MRGFALSCSHALSYYFSMVVVLLYIYWMKLINGACLVAYGPMAWLGADYEGFDSFEMFTMAHPNQFSICLSACMHAAGLPKAQIPFLNLGIYKTEYLFLLRRSDVRWAS